MTKQLFEFKPVISGLSACTSLALLLGCAAQKPAPQYVKAQKTYDDVSESKAQEYAPDELLEAKKLLNAAGVEKNGSERQVQLAYLADRQARLAQSSGTIEYYQNEAEQAQSNYIAGLEAKSSSTQEELAATRDELNNIEEEMQKKDANVEQLESRKAELESRRRELESALSEKEAALTQAERERQRAEERAAAAMASLNELAKVKEDAHETVITLSGSVLFKTGQADLLPVAANNLNRVAEAIKTMDDDKQIVIEGYTDSRGAEQMNQTLSRKRAESVMHYLQKEGVDQGRMKAVGKGEANPVASNDSPEGRANNRRVELHISDGESSNKSAAKSVDQRDGPS